MVNITYKNIDCEVNTEDYVTKIVFLGQQSNEDGNLIINYRGNGVELETHIAMIEIEYMTRCGSGAVYIKGYDSAGLTVFYNMFRHNSLDVEISGSTDGTNDVYLNIFSS